MTAAGKKLRFILSVRSDFHMIESLSIAVHTFVSRVSMSFSVDETQVGEFVYKFQRGSVSMYYGKKLLEIRRIGKKNLWDFGM